MRITWTAKNNSTFINGERGARTLLGASRAAKSWIRNEAYGEGIATIMVDGEPVRTIERSIFTGYRWVSEAKETRQ